MSGTFFFIFSNYNLVVYSKILENVLTLYFLEMTEIDYEEIHFLVATFFILISTFFIMIEDKSWIAMMLLAFYFLGYNLWNSRTH